MPSSRVVFLEDVCDPNPTLLGSKGAGLARLLRAGFPVPSGFCVLADAYQEHVYRCGLYKRLEGQLDALRTASAEEHRNRLQEFRAAFTAEPFDQTLRARIGACLDRLGAQPLAVRSSATAEDLPGHSFAGQYDTYLGIEGLAACVDAIKKSWASLWTDRAFQYRERSGFNHMDVRMAVVVQTLIQADVSGVLFTADPTSGSRDRIVIESCFGLGEALVSGKVSPDRCVLSRDGLRVISRTVSEKRIACVLDGGQVVEMPLPEARAHAACLNKGMARTLAEMALKVEAVFGTPQDIEWTVRDGAISMLQSRPITTLAAEKSWADRQVWTNSNTAEVMPDVVTPLTWSLIGLLIGEMFGSMAGGIGLSLGEHPIVGLVGGRVYFNINTVVGMLRRFPGLRRMDVTRTLGGAHGDLRIPDEDIPRLTFNPFLVMLRAPLFVVRAIARPYRQHVAFIAEVNRRATNARAQTLETMAEGEISARLERAVDEVRQGMEGITFAGSGMFWFIHLEKICHRWLGGAAGEHVNRLLAGVGGMDSAESGLALWRLAMTAHADRDVETIVLMDGTWESTAVRLSLSASGRSFLVHWDAFMATHGHHTRGEVELLNPRWVETPNYILEAVRGYLRALGETNAIEHHAQRGREREALADECRARLRNPLKRWWFNVALARAQRGCTTRENVKSALVRYLCAVRFILLALGKRLVDRGALMSRDDVFFLDLEELRRVLRREEGINAAETVAAHRREYEMNLTITPPSVVVGRWDPATHIANEVVVSGETFHGIAVSPGVAIGPARVILRAESGEQVLPGEILVAPFTDPGWTPYFLTAAAIVMDQGGMLSHGSIVAREYGIPSVVNVGPATKTIRTGQTVRVDGTRGVVTIVDAESH